MEQSPAAPGAAAPARVLGAGTTVDRYTVEALIGRGGMGEVYRALDLRLRRKVALKVVRPDTERNPDGVARLLREARAAAALAHPNAVAIHDLGEEDGLFFIVMELVNGQPLLAYVGDDRISLPRRLKWLAEIGRALATAHAKGVIHRDVKPSNVMISEDDVAKVLDFGLAKPIPRSGAAPESIGFRTMAGRVLGTVRYMAPEQMLGSEADGRADQYALGMTAYELIAGRYPSTKPFELPPPLDTVVPDFPADGARAITRMLSRLADDRFPSMDDVVSAFEDLAQNRPVRALDVAGQAPLRARADESSIVVTLPEPPIGSTLTSAPEDALSADSRIAAEEALMPTVTPSQLAVAGVGQTPLIITKDEPIPSSAQEPRSKPAQSAAAKASSTLASADTSDAVARVRAEASRLAEKAKVEVVEPPSPVAPPKASTPPPTASPDTPMEIVATKPSKDDPPVVREKKKSNTLLYVVVILFLAVAAFAGNYLGARSRGP